MNAPLIAYEPPPEKLRADTAWAESVTAHAKKFVINDDTAATAVGNQVGVMRQAQDASIAFRQSFTGPLYAVIKRIEVGFRPFLKACDAAVEELQARLLEYRARVEAQRAAALPAAARMAEQIVTFEDAQRFQQQVAQGSIVVEKRVGAVVFAEKWRAKVVNPSIVPVAVCVDGVWKPLWKIDDELLQSLAGPTATPIPGIEFEKYEDVSQVRRT